MEQLQIIGNENYKRFENNAFSEPKFQSINQTLDKMFPEQEREDKSIREAKEILGLLAEQFDDQQIKDILVEIQFLTESWLDDFERSIFNGLTLQELFHEKGAL